MQRALERFRLVDRLGKSEPVLPHDTWRMRIDSLDSRFEIVSRQPPASDHALEVLADHYPFLPDEFIALCREATSLIIRSGHVQIRFWSPTACVAADPTDRAEQLSRTLIPIGDNGSQALVYFEGPSGFGLYLADLAELDAQETTFVAPSVTALLSLGVGLELL